MSWTSPGRLIFIQFLSCVQEKSYKEIISNVIIFFLRAMV